MQLLTIVLDWCFPPRAEELRVRRLTPDILTMSPKYFTNNTVGLLPFHHPDVRAVIHEAKFFYNTRAHHIIGTLAASYIEEHYPDATIIPVPLHRARERERGFNQVTACLQSYLTLRPKIKTNILFRSKATTSQTKLSATERQQNVANAFTVPTNRRHSVPPNTPILLVDDVYTTGATLNTAQATLRATFPHHTINCLAFAYA